jgi:hypothetical protein
MALFVLSIQIESLEIDLLQNFKSYLSRSNLAFMEAALFLLESWPAPTGRNCLQKARMGYPKVLKSEHLAA